MLTNDYIEERNFVAVDDLAKFTPGLCTLVNDSGRSPSSPVAAEYDEVNLNGLPSPMRRANYMAPCRRWRRWIRWRSCGALRPLHSTSELGA